MIKKRKIKSGSRWDVRLRHPNGKEYWRTFKSLKEAKQFEASEKIDKARGNWIDPNAGSALFEDWATEWLITNKEVWRPRTYDRHEMAIRIHWTPCFKNIELFAITPRIIQRIINKMTSKYAATSVHTYYATLKTIMESALDMEILNRNPCKGVKLPPNKPEARTVVTPAEIHQLAEAVGSKWRCTIYLAGIMGLRFGEVLGLQLQDIDFEKEILTINRTVVDQGGHTSIGPPKTALSKRQLMLSDNMKNELKKHIEREQIKNKNQHLFTNGNGELVRRGNYRSRVFQPALKQIGLEGITFHGLRHSAATEWIAAGIDPKTVQHKLGHTNPKITLELYTHYSTQADKQATELLDEIYWR